MWTITIPEVVQLWQTYRVWYLKNLSCVPPWDNPPISCGSPRYVLNNLPPGEYCYRDHLMMFVSFHQKGFWIFPAQGLVTVAGVRIGQTQTTSTQYCL